MATVRHPEVHTRRETLEQGLLDAIRYESMVPCTKHQRHERIDTTRIHGQLGRLSRTLPGMLLLPKRVQPATLGTEGVVEIVF